MRKNPIYLKPIFESNGNHLVYSNAAEAYEVFLLKCYDTTHF